MSPRAPLFSTGLAIKNFRGYGTFNIELPARPCVVLLSGPNGLGKTSLFEALEWALTGSVKRLDHVSGGKANPRDLVRHAPNVDAFEVSLAFQDGEEREERVTRAQLIPKTSATPPAPIGTPPADVAQILSSGDPRWNVTGQNLADYLHLTHLHAQVAFLRLVACDAKNRWMRVSPLAGADRFERVRTNLTNSKKELTRLRERRTQELDAAVEKRQQWTDLLTRLDQLRKVAGTVHDLLSPSDVSARVSDLRERLGLAARQGGTQPQGAALDLSQASEDLRDLRVDVEAAGGAVARRIEDVGRLRAMPQQLADMRNQHATYERRTNSLKAETEALRSRVSGLEEATKAHRAAYDDALKRQQEAANSHELTVRAQRDRADLAPCEVEVADAEEQLRTAQQKMEELELDLRRRREILAAHESRLRERDRAREQLTAVERAFAALTEIETLQNRLGEEQARYDVLATALQKLDSEIAGARAEEHTRDDDIAAVTREIEGLRQAFDALQKALLAIADHVSDDDTQCPVCRTNFDHGVLRGLARDAVGSRDPKLVDAEDRLRAVIAGREEVRKQQAERALQRRKVEADLRALKGNIAQLGSRVTSLRTDRLLAERGNDEARLELTRVRATLVGDLERTERELAEQPGGDELKRVVLEGTTASETQRRLHAVAQERRNARQTRLEQLRARIGRTQSELPDLAGDAHSLELAVQVKAVAASNAKDVADSASVRLAEAQAAENAMRQTLATVETDAAKVAAQVTSLVSALDAIVKRWRDASLPEPISERTLDAEIEKQGHSKRALDGALQAVAALAAALDRWRHADELQAVEAEIRRECGSRESDVHERELDVAVERANAAASSAQRAREASDELSATLNKVTAEFGGRALRPFDELFRRYVRALIHDERFHTIEATYKPAARSAGLSFRVDLGVSTEAEYILSEGQLGEVSLATMLAASSAFPWSRWRVLLLDDPTQYNDLIHATALFDVLRNLVRFARYQIFVSTHDNEQAAFLRRKLDAIDTPWIDCRYVAHSPEGIVADVRRSFDEGEGTLASGG